MRRSRIFFRGVPGPMARKQSGHFFFSFLVLNLIYRLQWGSKSVSLQRKLYFSKDPEGVQHFPGWGEVELFPGRGGGVEMLLSIETLITCDFSGGGGWGGGGGGVRTPYPLSGSQDDLTYFF